MSMATFKDFFTLTNKIMIYLKQFELPSKEAEEKALTTIFEGLQKDATANSSSKAVIHSAFFLNLTSAF